LPAQLNISLFPLPAPVGGSGSGGGGGGFAWAPTPFDLPGADPLTPDAVSSLIVHNVEQGKWTEAEGVAVRMLYGTVVRALGSSRLAAELRVRLAMWISWLKKFGIRVKGTSNTPGSTPIQRPMPRTAGA
jgi:hypothetical protein